MTNTDVMERVGRDADQAALLAQVVASALNFFGMRHYVFAKGTA